MLPVVENADIISDTTSLVQPLVLIAIVNHLAQGLLSSFDLSTKELALGQCTQRRHYKMSARLEG